MCVLAFLPGLGRCRSVGGLCVGSMGRRPRLSAFWRLRHRKAMSVHFFEGVLLGEAFFDLVGDLWAGGAYEHYVVERGSPEEVGDEEGAGVDVWVVVVYYESADLFALFSVFLEGVDYCVLPFAQAPAYVCLERAT